MPDALNDRSSGIACLPVFKYHAAGLLETEDQVAVEEPLEIRLIQGPVHQRKEQPISVTMRTPGNDKELAMGFLFTEGIIESSAGKSSAGKSSAGDILTIHQGGGIPDNVVCVEMKEDLTIDLGKLQRNFYTSSSCGVCGKSSIQAIRSLGPPGSSESPAAATSNDTPGQSSAQWQVDSVLIRSLPEQLRRQQELFASTGGLHASALFDRGGNLLFLREDIGRHNALDKLIGHALNNDLLPLGAHILLLSGRACFELIQKAAMAGIRVVAAIGPPSSLAVQLAEEYDITLIGFLREERFNIYTGVRRVALDLPAR